MTVYLLDDSMIAASFDTIDAADLHRLVASGASEGRDLEFKRELPGGSDAEIKEFLADVTSLANAHGGDLVFGVEESAGTATRISGVAPTTSMRRSCGSRISFAMAWSRA